MISVDSETALQRMGNRLRNERIARNDSQKRFAARIGVSIPTLRKLENGDPNVAIGTLMEALWVLDRLKDVDAILSPPKSLFQQLEQKQAKKRFRASKRKNP
jgi:transcriptional regulator with XRE-family HTH domain